MFISLSFFFHNKIIKTMNERGNLTKELLSYILQKDSLNFHKRLSIQSLIIANCRPMFTICQHLYTLGVEVKFTRSGDFTWKSFRQLNDCQTCSVVKVWE